MISNRGKKYHRMNKFSYIAIAIVMALLLQSVVFEGKAEAVVTSDLSVIINNPNMATLSWKDNLSDEKYYYVEKSIDGGSFNTLSYYGKDLTTYTDNTLMPGRTYTYRIKVMDSTNMVYIYTNEVSFRTNDIDIPDSLTVTPVKDNQIDVKWTYPGDKAYNTIVERRADGDTHWYEVARVGIGQNTYSDMSIISGARYYYKVRAYSTDSVKSAAYPDEYTGNGAYALLLKPTNLYGYALSQYQIQLKWQDNSAETAFIIERKAPDEGTFKEIAVVPQNSNGYIDNVPKENALYEYRVKAVTGTTMSEYSDTATVASTYLRMPSALSAAAVDGKTVNLTWQDMTSGETGFEIWRKAASDTDWTLYDTMGRNATSYVDTNVMPQTTYSYKVRAKINDNSIYSDFSNEANILMSTISGPSNLTCNVVTNTQVDLTWDDNSNVEAGFIVEKKVGILSQWNQIASLNPNTTKYTDKWISGSDIVSYRIRAFDRSNIIGYSNEVTVSTKTPTPPTNLKVTAVSTNDMKLTWSDNSTSEEGFIIEAKQLYVFKEIGRVGSGVTTFEYMDASPGKAATYRVRAVNGSMQSNPSNEVTATPLTGAAYTDLASVSWAVEAINNLSSRNVFDAKTDSKFYPAQNITKGEYCSILVRSLGLQEVAAGRFADVTSKHKYYMEIVSAQRKGIITPDKNNRLYPDSLVTREQAGVMLALALKIKGTPLPERDTSSLKQFADYRSVSEASANSIAAVCGAGIFSGRKINDKVYLQLANKVTRAEAALMVYKGLYYKK